MTDSLGRSYSRFLGAGSMPFFSKSTSPTSQPTIKQALIEIVLVRAIGESQTADLP